jgi:hypothetical protein
MTLRQFFAFAFLVFLLTAGTSGYCKEPASGVVVNGTPVSEQEMTNLRRQMGVPATSPIPAGEYWYDRTSGLWGKRGGPTLGQILPGLDLGGPLRADASSGDTGVFINGRQIHRDEWAFLQQLYGTVIPGRYWLDASGTGGYEGGPPLFHLGTAAAARGGAGGQGGYNRRTPFGSIGGDSNCSYYLHPGGSSVLTCD